MLVIGPLSVFLEGLWNLFHSSFPILTATQIFLLMLGDHLMVQVHSVNAGGWTAAYKAHGAFFGVAEVAVIFWRSCNITWCEKFIYGASEGVLKWDKGIVSRKDCIWTSAWPLIHDRKNNFFLPLSLTLPSPLPKNFPLLPSHILLSYPLSIHLPLFFSFLSSSLAP